MQICMNKLRRTFVAVSIFFFITCFLIVADLQEIRKL